MSKITYDRADLAAGLIFIAFGLWFGIKSLDLELGTALRMGPGLFPLILSGVMVLLGAIVTLQSLRKEGEPVGTWAWRGMFFILLAPIFFGLTVRGLGFVPALFFTALIAGLATDKLGIPRLVLLAAAVTVFSTVVFVEALGLPFRMFGPWLPAF